MNVGDVKRQLAGAGLQQSLDVGGIAAPEGNVIPLRPRLPNAPGQVQLPAGKWAKYAGKLGGALTVTISAAVIRKGGYEPNQPDDSDVDLLVEALEEGLKLRFGDGPVPWWLGAALAAGGVYAGMRIGAAKLPPKVLKPVTNDNANPLDSIPPVRPTL